MFFICQVGDLAFGHDVEVDLGLAVIQCCFCIERICIVMYYQLTRHHSLVYSTAIRTTPSCIVIAHPYMRIYPCSIDANI